MVSCVCFFDTRVTPELKRGCPGPPQLTVCVIGQLILRKLHCAATNKML